MNPATIVKPEPGRVSSPPSTCSPAPSTNRPAPSTSQGRPWWWDPAGRSCTCTSACTGGCNPAATSSRVRLRGTRPCANRRRRPDWFSIILLEGRASSTWTCTVPPPDIPTLTCATCSSRPIATLPPHRVRARRRVGSGGRRPRRWLTMPSWGPCAPPASRPSLGPRAGPRSPSPDRPWRRLRSRKGAVPGTMVVVVVMARADRCSRQDMTGGR
jgi:hypothetical protein